MFLYLSKEYERYYNVPRQYSPEYRCKCLKCPSLKGPPRYINTMEIIYQTWTVEASFDSPLSLLLLLPAAFLSLRIAAKRSEKLVPEKRNFITLTRKDPGGPTTKGNIKASAPNIYKTVRHQYKVQRYKALIHFKAEGSWTPNYLDPIFQISERKS